MQQKDSEDRSLPGPAQHEFLPLVQCLKPTENPEFHARPKLVEAERYQPGRTSNAAS